MTEADLIAMCYDVHASAKPGRRTLLVLAEQWRFPRSKKRRIRRKWANDERNWRPDASVRGLIAQFHENTVR